jgi:hypothetical protein
MPPLLTPVLQLAKPEVNGADTENTWGFDINANFDKIDAFALTTVDDAPADGVIYGRQDSDWTPVSPLGHVHPPSEITGFDEAIDDRVAGMLVPGANITIDYDDAGDTLTISATFGGGAGVADGDWGDITVSGNGTVWTIDPETVDFPKVQRVLSGVILGRSAAGVGLIEQLTAEQARILIDAAPSDHTHPASDITGLDAAIDGKVDVAGDTMTGPLAVPTLNAGAVNATGAVTANTVTATGAGAYVQAAGPVVGDTLSANKGVVYVQNYSDVPDRGVVSFGTGGHNLEWNGTRFVAYGSFTATGDIDGKRINASNDVLAYNSGNANNNGNIFFGVTGSAYLSWFGGAYTLRGGQLTVEGALVSNGEITTRNASGATGTVRFGNAGVAYLYFDGTGFSFSGHGMTFNSGVAVNAMMTAYNVTISQGNMFMRNYAGDPNQSVIYLNAANTHYLHNSGGNLVYPSGIITAVNGRLWGAADGALTTTMRLLYCVDYQLPIDGVMVEAWGGTVITGMAWTGYSGSLITCRWRYLQFFYGGNWYTVGYA